MWGLRRLHHSLPVEQSLPYVPITGTFEQVQNLKRLSLNNITPDSSRITPLSLAV
jgi:hypothetical protein